MSDSFTISTPSNTVKLDKNHQTKVTFTVTNTENRPIRGRLQLLADGKTKPSWLSLSGEGVRDFAAGDSQQVAVQIKVPPAVTGGSYNFRLKVIGEDNSEEAAAEGPSITLVVPDKAKDEGEFPWWVLMVLAAVILIGAFAIYQSRRGDGPAANNQTAVHTVGEEVAAGELVLVLTRAEGLNSLLAVTFSIENKGQSDVAFSPVANFEAAAADGTIMQQVLLGCESIRASGTLAPGDTVLADICYRVVGSGPYTISFRSEQTNDEAIVWQVE